MAKARQQYFADETSLQKDSREFAIADDVQQKIDSIEEGAQVNVIETVKVNGTALTPDANKAVDIDVPDVIDNLYTTSSDDALSANQGKLLYDYIQNLSSRGRFLSNWNTATGLPTTNPSENPYTYMAGDYYMVSNVASGGGTNYRPNGSSYTIGQASTTVETNIVDVSDIYLYDGTNWLLLTNSSRQIAVDSSLSTTSTNPVENRVVTNAINGKQATLTASTGISIDGNNNISNTLPGPTIAATAPTGTEGALWYDTTNNVLMAHNGTSWKEAGTQMVVLSYGNSTWNDFITAYADNAVVYCRASSNADPSTGSQGRMAFMAYVNNATNPTEVEFQYYRSRSDHNSAANQLDQVFVYKLTSASGGTWTVTERNTAAKAVAGTGINLAFGSGNMTISNTGVTSVNGDTGAVTVNDVKKSATAPSSPTEGMVWYDTTNDQLKVYDGTNWNVTGKEYNAGPGISIGQYQDYSAMRGPAPDGFHVPSKDEWVALCGILTTTFSMASNATTMGTYLKMPMAGYRYFDDADVYNVGSDSNYWSSTPNDTYNAYYLNFTSSYIKPQEYYDRAYGFSVRCFKDYPTIPTSSWTTLYDGSSVASGAGVFYNSTDGLISVSGNGVTRYTIQDKNLGATTVFNQGDAATDANCGYFYQRGNNYGFAHSGNITTSDTQVDASNYGPGNYYSSSTFINYYSGTWDSSDNGNLRGGETGVVTLNNAITNTGVLSVNGQTGDVAIQEGIEYNAGEGIEIGDSYSAMQGPAPDGFHVPLSSEWDAVKTVWTTLGGGSSDGTNFGIALKLPFAGYRDLSSADVSNQGTYGRYWSSSRYNENLAYLLNLKSTALGPHNNNYRANGFSVRCFKNTPTIPTSSWTKLYGTSIEAGGIFWSSADGLISLSSDGSNWITIADKNLGATTVWNSGDTLSEANCGKYYQWGNNYGFPRTGTIADTSTTQVDASTYGPGNYYSSSTFIKRSSSPYRWDTTDNGNLWGGETGVIPDAITNTGVLSVNGQTGDVTIATPEESNTKTFYLSSTSDLTNAQAAYDWYVAGKNPIVIYDGANYTYYQSSSSSIYFAGNKYSYSTTSSGTQTQYYYVRFTLSSGAVTGIYTGTYGMGGKYLTTDNTTSYTPSGNYNPATKKYVDDSIGGLSQIKVHLVSLPFSIGDDWSAIWDDLDGGGYSVVLADGSNRTGLVTFWSTSPSNTVTVVAGEETYKVTLDSDYEISAIDIVGGLRKFDIGISEATASTDVTDLVNYLDKGGNAYIHDSLATLDWYIGWYTNHSINLFSCAYGYVYMLQFTFTQSGIHWYAGTPTSDNVYEFFNPSNAGSTGQVLTKTATGYNWANSGVNTKTFYITTTGSGDTAKAEAQAALDWYLAGNNPIIIYSNRAYILHSYSSSSIYFRSLYANYSDSSSYSYDYFNALYFNISSGSVTSTSTSTAAFSGYYLRTGKDYATPYTPTYNGSPATKKYVDDKVAEAIGNDTTGTTTTITKIWAGTEAEFANLQTKDSSTIYYTF